jgi:aspartate-semialdehyde dehydrogenase
VKIVLVGATGAVGTEMLSILEGRDLAIDELVPVASARSAGRRLSFRGSTVEVHALTEEVFRGADVALFDVPDDVSVEWAPVAARHSVVVDNSAAWRMDPEVPLVVPEVNPGQVGNRPKNIISSPNCTTLALVVPIGALHRAAGLERLIVSSYQATSGAGRPGVDELWDQTEKVAKEPELVRDGLAREVLSAGETFAHPIAMNFIPKCGSLTEDGYTSEEVKMRNETRKIIGLPELRVTATCVRVPVMVGHGVAAHAEFSRPITPEEARSVLSAAPGVVVRDDPGNDVYPTPLESAGTDPCYVGRIRRDPFDDRALELFCVADNLRKGAALNTVQVAGLLF